MVDFPVQILSQFSLDIFIGVMGLLIGGMFVSGALNKSNKVKYRG